MSLNCQQIITETPTALSLIEPIRLNCMVEGCLAVFQNTGNLHMHMLKHHGINISANQSENAEKRFFCPDANCKYHISHEQDFFATRKLLRQHFSKVHAAKTIKCQHCDKLFATSTLKNVHERRCLDELKCVDCGWTYSSRESLLTHCRRKNHSILKRFQHKTPKLLTILKVSPSKTRKLLNTLPKSSVAAVVAKEKVGGQKSQTTQTRETKSTNTIADDNQQNDDQQIDDQQNGEFLDNWNKRIQQASAIETHSATTVERNCQTIDYFDTETASQTSQTDKNLNKMNYVDDETSSLNYFGGSSALCHIETQTELFGEPAETTSSQVNADNLESMLYTNMYTQTCDEILSELGLADIQTQTNWPSGDYGEMFVSTETQTSFSANFLENTSTYTQTGCFGDVIEVKNEDDNDGVFKEFGKNNSQSTQTAFENCLREID